MWVQFAEGSGGVVDPQVGFASGSGEGGVAVFGCDAGVGVEVGGLEGLALGGVDGLGVGVVEVGVDVPLGEGDLGVVDVAAEGDAAGGRGRWR